MYYPEADYEPLTDPGQIQQWAFLMFGLWCRCIEEWAVFTRLAECT